jgi:hypothetical protein
MGNDGSLQLLPPGFRPFYRLLGCGWQVSEWDEWRPSQHVFTTPGDHNFEGVVWSWCHFVSGIVPAQQLSQTCACRCLADSGAAPTTAGPSNSTHFVVVGGLASNSNIQVLALDAGTGVLSPISESSAGGPFPSFIAWQPGAATVRHLFVANEANTAASAGVTAVRWEAAPAQGLPGSSALAPAPVPVPHILPVTDGGGFVSVPYTPHVAVSPSGRWVLTAGYNDGTISVVEVRAQGAAGGSQLALGTPRTLPKEQVGKNPHQVGLSMNTS